MTEWTFNSRPEAAGRYVIGVGGSPMLATWNARDERWFDGYRFIDEKHVRGYIRIPEFTVAAGETGGDFPGR